MRSHGPLTFTSAFVFENFYGEMRNSFTPGTPSPLKQIMSKILLKRQIEYHSCNAEITFTNYDTELECNNLFYTFIHLKYRFFKIIDIDSENDIMVCKEIEKEEPEFEDTPSLKWEKVGVYVELGELLEIHRVKKTDICGKLIRVKQYLLTCPMNILEEK